MFRTVILSTVMVSASSRKDSARISFAVFLFISPGPLVSIFLIDQYQLYRIFPAISEERSTCGTGTMCREADTGVPVPHVRIPSRGTPLIMTAFFPCSFPHIGAGTLVPADAALDDRPVCDSGCAALGASPICASGRAALGACPHMRLSSRSNLKRYRIR